MSTDEKSRRIAQAHLNPGETLVWAGQTAARRAARRALWAAAAAFLFFLTFGAFAAFLSWHMDQQSAQFWATHPYPGGTPPGSGLDFLDPLFLFGGLGVIAGAFFGACFYCAKPMTYAITDRRLLFLSTTSGASVPVAAYGPEDIQFVRRHDHRDGTSDLLISRAEPTRGTLGMDGIAVPFQWPTADVGLRGIADAGAVEALIAALRSGERTAAVPTAAAVPAALPPVGLPGEREIVFKKFTIPWMVGAIFFLSGLPFVGIGIAAGLGQIVTRSGEGASATPASPLTGLLGFGGVGLAFSLLGAGMLLWRDGFTADPVTRTYRMQRGFAPFARPVTGPFADFDRIRLTREDDTDSESQYKHSWRVSLLWKEGGRKPFDLLVTPFAPHGTDEAHRFAAALGLPLEDRSAELTPVEQKTQAALADPVVQARKARKQRVWIAVNVVAGVLCVNSLLKGVVLEDQWTTPNGSAITRRTTGFWWQTVAISPQGERSSHSDQHLFFSSSSNEGTLPDISGPRTNYRCGLRLGSRMEAEDAPVPLPFLSPGQAATDSFQAATDSFQAAPGTPLSGQGGGTGWVGNWSGTGALVAAGSLADPSGTLAVEGHSVQLSAPSGQFLNLSRHLAFHLGGANTTAWMGFTIKRTRFTRATALPAFGGVCLGLTGRDPQLFIGDTGSGRWGMNTVGGRGTVNARAVEANVPVLLVVRADFRPGGDRFTLYQNPTPGRIAPNVAGVVKTDFMISGVDGVALTAGRGNAYTLDELRVGTSYRDVAPSRPKSGR